METVLNRRGLRPHVAWLGERRKGEWVLESLPSHDLEHLYGKGKNLEGGVRRGK